jgi:hypothetical protein
MWNIKAALGRVVTNLSSNEKNYKHSLDFFRFWIGVEQTYSQTPSDSTFDAIWEYKATQPDYKNASVIIKFIDDIQSDGVLGPHNRGLRERFCKRLLEEFFEDNLKLQVEWIDFCERRFFINSHLIAHCANHGYISKNAIRDHILQSLSQEKDCFQHQRTALCILFKVAGGTFNQYCDHESINLCFNLLRGHQCAKSNLGYVGTSVEVSKI